MNVHSVSLTSRLWIFAFICNITCLAKTSNYSKYVHKIFIERLIHKYYRYVYLGQSDEIGTMRDGGTFKIYFENTMQYFDNNRKMKTNHFPRTFSVPAVETVFMDASPSRRKCYFRISILGPFILFVTL